MIFASVTLLFKTVLFEMKSTIACKTYSLFSSNLSFSKLKTIDLVIVSSFRVIATILPSIWRNVKQNNMVHIFFQARRTFLKLKNATISIYVVKKHIFLLTAGFLIFES